MSLQSVMKQIELKTAAANDDLRDATNFTRQMREGNKRAAKESLEDLKNDYRRLMISSSTFVVVTGSGANDLVALTSPETKSFGVDAETFYQTVADKIDSRAYTNQTVASSIFNNINGALEEVARVIGVQSFPYLRFKTEYSGTITDKDQFVQLVKRAINDEMGSQLVGVSAVSQIMEQALSRNHDDNFVPILLNTQDESLALSLAKDLKNLNSNVFLVAVGKASKTVRNAPNSISIKEASPEALQQLLEGIKSKQ